LVGVGLGECTEQEFDDVLRVGVGDLWAKKVACGMKEGLEVSCRIADELEAGLACGDDGGMGAGVVVV
jgi:hypothetical protein